MRPGLHAYSQYGAPESLHGSLDFSRLRCKGMYSNVSFLTLPYKLSNYFLLSDNQ